MFNNRNETIHRHVREYMAVQVKRLYPNEWSFFKDRMDDLAAQYSLGEVLEIVRKFSEQKRALPGAEQR